MAQVFMTQGGGVAQEKNGALVWLEPPDWMDEEAAAGDPIPEEWGVMGPYDSEDSGTK